MLWREVELEELVTLLVRRQLRCGRAATGRRPTYRSTWRVTDAEDVDELAAARAAGGSAGVALVTDLPRLEALAWSPSTTVGGVVADVAEEGGAAHLVVRPPADHPPAAHVEVPVDLASLLVAAVVDPDAPAALDRALAFGRQAGHLHGLRIVRGAGVG